MPGQIISDRFRIVSLVGKGGMGEVYRADDLKLGEPVALKFLPTSLEKDPDRLRRFLNEVRVARTVTHPHVCRVHDVFEAGGQHFLSMEYVEGENLASLLRQIGRVTEERAVEVARQICAGLSAAHEQGILHRDLKPANIMIDSRGKARLTDFGLAGLAEEFSGREAAAGTPAYMAPEQLEGKGVSAQSDIYSLGLVLYELFTGKAAFQGNTIEELKRLRSESTPSLPSSVHDGIDPAVERAILRCLKTDPKERPKSARMVASALPGGDPLAAALAAGETPSPEMVAEAGSDESLRPLLAAVLGGVAVLAYLLGTYLQGSMTLTAHLPMDRPPQVLVNQAREIIADFGYTEPVYADPADSAFGFFVWSDVMRQILARDTTAERWEMAGDRPDLVAFWYRQSRVPLRPMRDPRQLGPTPVTLENPAAETPGNIEVLLDVDGRLKRFRYTPKRFSSAEPIPAEIDWERVFALAGLDMDRFQPARPRYQRFLAPDERFAWEGTRERGPDVQWRVDAGTFEGRLALFNLSEASALEALAQDPQPFSSAPIQLAASLVVPLFALSLMIVAALLARRNWLRGRCDARGARRLGVFIGSVILLNDILGSHSLFEPMGLSEIFPIAAGGLFAGMFAWTGYLALEPYGRQVWPSLFVSSSRLLSRERVRWRDPQVGRSVLTGVLAGSVAALVYPLFHLAPMWLGAAALPILTPAWEGLVGQRYALALLLRYISGALLNTLFPALVLVTFLRLTKRKRLAVVLTAIVWPVFYVVGSPSPWIPSVVFCLVALVVLMRFGLLALTVFLAIDQTYLVSATDWTAWHSQPYLFALVFVAALIGYGFWASTSGRKMFEEEPEIG